MKKRLLATTCALGILLAALIGRLIYIQFIGHDDLSQTAKAQQLIALEGANTRGFIYDRNNTPLVGNYREYIFIIRQECFDGEAMQALDAMDAREIKNEDNGYKVYASRSYDKELGERLIRNAGAYIMEVGRRYGQEQKAAHILGYVNPQDASGASGIELMCDEELSLLNKRVFATADVKGNILPGRGLVVSTDMEQDSYVKSGVTTTLESGLQEAVEEILSNEERNAAILVLKSDTGEIMASASTPTFDPTRISEYMESDRDELVNKVTQGEYPPGSVFKIVVAAAALEQGIDPGQTFTCDGHVTINGQKVNCKTGGETGHGIISFRDAFAQSCNSAFVQIGQKIGASAILDMAERMGLGKEVLDGYPGEKTGNLMTEQQAGGAAISNLAIGQGETLMTPLQVGKMTNIVAAGGKDTGVHILLETEDVEESEDSQVISLDTAQALQDMMRETMVSGSGKALKADVEMAGKTGSAESQLGGEEAVHGWMTGFAPAENPEYTITVFVEAGGTGSQSAGPLFAQVAQYLSDSKSFEKAVGF